MAGQMQPKKETDQAKFELERMGVEGLFSKMQITEVVLEKIELLSQLLTSLGVGGSWAE